MNTTPVIGRRHFIGSGAALLGAATLAPRMALAAEENITVSINGGTSEKAFSQIFAQEGILKKWQIDMHRTAINDGSKIAASILSGSSAMCPASGYSQILVAIEKGADLKLVCGASDKVAQAVFSWRDDIKTIADLKGKTVAIGSPGSLLNQYMVTLLKKAGVDPKSVKFVNAGSSVNTFRAVAGKIVDAAPGLVNAIPLAEKSGLHIIAKVWEELPHFPYQAGYASTSAIKAKREEIIRTICCYGDLYDFIQSDKPSAKTDYVKAFTDTTSVKASAAAFQWDFIHDNHAYQIDLDPAAIDYLQELNIEFGLQKKKMPLEQVADLTMLEEAKKRLAAT